MDKTTYQNNIEESKSTGFGNVEMYQEQRDPKDI